MRLSLPHALAAIGLALGLIGAAAPAKASNANCVSSARAERPHVEFLQNGRAFDPRSDVQAVAEIEVYLKNNGSQPCTVVISGLETPVFLRHDSKGVHYESRSIEGVDSRTVQVPAGDETVVTLRYGLVDQRSVVEGVYRRNFALRIAGANGASGNDRRLELSLILRVPYVADLSFEPGVGVRNASHDFGRLEPNEEAVVPLYVRSSGEYALRITSRNRGKLVSNQTASGAKVGYSATLDGRTLNLSSSRGDVTRASPATEGSWSRRELRVRIGEMQGLAGVYTDTLTIAIESCM